MSECIRCEEGHEASYCPDCWDALKKERAELTGWADLMVDEFKRISACPGVGAEIKDLCERAIKNTKQKVPVIVQRDKAESILAVADTLAAAVGSYKPKGAGLPLEQCHGVPGECEDDSCSEIVLCKSFAAYNKVRKGEGDEEPDRSEREGP